MPTAREPGRDGARPSSTPPTRSRPAHMPVIEIGNRTIIVYLTVCTKNRNPVLARRECVAALKNAWAETDRWIVGRYVVMPEHIHMFCTPGIVEYPPVKKWVECWKSICATRWPHPGDGKLWQRDCWDRQLRNGESYSEKWEYVRRNPVRAGLVTQPDNWPWQGEMNVLRWHEP